MNGPHEAPPPLPRDIISAAGEAERAAGSAPGGLTPEEYSFPAEIPFAGFLETFGMALGFLLLSVVLSGIVVVFMAGFGLQMPPDNLGPLLFVNIPAAIGVMLWAVLRVKGRLPIVLPLRPVSVWTLGSIVVFVLGSTVLISELDNVFRWVLPLPNFAEEMFKQVARQPVIAVLVMVVMAPITEEAIFRGAILGPMARVRGPVAASVWSAVLFGVIHINPAQIPTAFILGLIFAWWTLRTGSLWPALLGHALHNGMPVILSLPFVDVDIRGFTAIPEPGTFQPLWFDALGVVFLTLGAMAFLRATRTPAQPHTETEGDDENGSI
jgi:hypothetical protein